MILYFWEISDASVPSGGKGRKGEEKGGKGRKTVEKGGNGRKRVVKGGKGWKERWRLIPQDRLRTWGQLLRQDQPPESGRLQR